jgi:hypothetical protein
LRNHNQYSPDSLREEVGWLAPGRPVCAAPATCALANKLNFNASIGLIGRFRAPGLAHCGAVQTLSIPFDKNFDLPWDFRACKKCRPDKANPG